MSLLGIFKKKPKAVEDIPIVDKSLYILMDSPKAGMVSYFSNIGIQIKALASSVEELKINLIFEENPYRLLIALDNSGIDLSEVLDIVRNNNGSISLVSSNNNLIKSVKKLVKKYNKLSKSNNSYLDIDYREYDNIKSIIDTLTSYREHYNVGGAKDKVFVEPLKFKGILSDIFNESNVSFDDSSVITDIANSELSNSVKQFTIKI